MDESTGEPVRVYIRDSGLGNGAMSILGRPLCPISYLLVYSRDGFSVQAYNIRSLVPRLFGGGEKRAWYLLFAHALN